MEINPAIAAMKYAVDALDSIAEQITIPKGTLAHEQLREVVALANRAETLRAELAEARLQLAAQPAVPEAVAKDAARYRWLRDQHKRHLGLTICKVNMFDLEPWSGDDPDTAIDAAILSATDSEVKNGNP